MIVKLKELSGKAVKPEDFKRKCHHPESGPIDMEFLLSLYAWHGRHHEGHIVGLRKVKGW